MSPASMQLARVLRRLVVRRQIQLAGAAAQVEERRAGAELKRAQAAKAMQPEAPPAQAAPRGHSWGDQAAMIARARSDAAAAELKQAQARRTMTEAALAPQELRHEMELARAGAPARLQHTHE